MRDSPSSVHPEEVPQMVFDTLVDEFGESQDIKYKGYVVSQSLEQLMGYLDRDQIISMRATADISNKDEVVKGTTPPGKARHCIEAREKLITEIQLNYSRSKHGKFPWGDVQEFLAEERTPIDDLAIRRLTIRTEAEELRDHLRTVLTDAVGLADKKYLKSPFFFTMKSRQAKAAERETVKEHNEEDFLKRVGYRVLELNKMYSLRAKKDKGDPVMGCTPRELEDLAFNHDDQQSQNFGALYSNLAINKWRQAFSRTFGEKTRFTWTDEGQWERADMSDSDGGAPASAEA